MHKEPAGRGGAGEILRASRLPASRAPARADASCVSASHTSRARLARLCLPMNDSAPRRGEHTRSVKRRCRWRQDLHEETRPTSGEIERARERGCVWLSMLVDEA